MTQSPTPVRGSYFPLQYWCDLLRTIRAHRDLIEVINYDHLSWADGDSHLDSYGAEWIRWRGAIRTGELDPTRAYLLIQHDVDAIPERTHRMLECERELGVASTVMIFNRLLKREVLEKEKRVEFDDYPIDDWALRRLEEAGFLVAYHSNAYEQAQFDQEEARDIFRRDVSALRRRFHVRYFCPHGGARDADGRSNAALELPFLNDLGLRWVAVGHGAHFNGYFSDGGLVRRKDTEALDLTRFVMSLQPGRRYRILAHPQYYVDGCDRADNLAACGWYRKVIDKYRAGVGSEVWEPVHAHLSALARQQWGARRPKGRRC